MTNWKKIKIKKYKKSSLTEIVHVSKSNEELYLRMVQSLVNEFKKRFGTNGYIEQIENSMKEEKALSVIMNGYSIAET